MKVKDTGIKKDLGEVRVQGGPALTPLPVPRSEGGSSRDLLAGGPSSAGLRGPGQGASEASLEGAE